MLLCAMTDAAASLDLVSHPNNIGEESVGSKREGHTQEDKIWQMFDKIPLSKTKLLFCIEPMTHPVQTHCNRLDTLQ